MRGHGQRTFLRQPDIARRSRVSAVNPPRKERPSLLTLARSTARALGRHAPLYGACAVALVIAQTALSAIWHVPNSATIVSEVLGGAFVTIVNVTTFGDATGASRPALIERGFERSWAVVIVGFAVDLFTFVGVFGLAAPSLVDSLLGGAVLLMTATLVFATVDATVSSDPWWWLVPAALSRSIVVGWRAWVFPRALIALAVGGVGAYGLEAGLEGLLSAHHVAYAALWAVGLANAILIPPVQTFATLVYLDATRV